MIQLTELAIKNFMSIGNVQQYISFGKDGLVLVLGENLDLGGNDNRNGTGKSTIVNALSYVLYGTALTNIRKDNLINKTNMKGMIVTLKFNVNGTAYTIERGRKPNIFKFIQDGVTQTTDITEDDEVDESQGEGRHTQEEIIRTIGVTHDIFKHIIALNTYVEPFLALRTNDQRMIIEQLLGITKLSEKAEKLKDEAKNTKDELKEEEIKIATIGATNRRIDANISVLQEKSCAWEIEKNKKITDLQASILELMSLDIDKEIELHKSRKEVDDLTAEYRSLTKELAAIEREVTETTKSITRLDKILASSVEKICPTCTQPMDSETHEQVHNEYVDMHRNEIQKLDEKNIKLHEIKSLSSAVKSIIPSLPETFYKNMDQAYNHKSILDKLGHSLESEMTMKNPYIEQIASLEKDGLQEIDFTKINELINLRDHQEFLLKLLTGKDSFIRKKIIDQNLSYLNIRLSHYLTNIGLPHTVKFKSDLEVEITMYGKEFDFDNLSRGERTRLILSLSWAFRDVYESMNDKINLVFLDEIVDQGLDTSGVDSTLAILKTMAHAGGRNIFLISHKDELTSRIPTILKVVKENGFTSILSV